jgi:hypothetical protein
MIHETIKEALKQSKELTDMRGDGAIPPVNYDIALCLYERDLDGTDAATPFLAHSRPQDFATNEHMKYQYFGAMKHHEQDGKKYMVCYLIHLYWDGSRDEDSARKLILNAGLFGYGEWRPTAPSDPLLMDDFWLSELGDPPNGYWEDSSNDFAPFDNFARQPYPMVDLTGMQSSD